MDYVQRIEFLTGPNINLAVPSNYVQDINTKAWIDEGLIEIKKKVAYEKGSSSKVLMVYAVQSDATTVDQKLFETMFQRY